jgi:predicted nucleic acid-binding protein
MRRYLLDASVWVAFLDTNDPHHTATKQLLGTTAGGQRFAALDLTLYEVANVAITSWEAPADAHLLFSLVCRCCPDAIVPVDEQLYELTISIAAEHRLSAYDASYIAAAQLNDWTLVSGDHRDLVDPGHAITAEAALAAG